MRESVQTVLESFDTLTIQFVTNYMLLYFATFISHVFSEEYDLFSCLLYNTVYYCSNMQAVLISYNYNHMSDFT